MKDDIAFKLGDKVYCPFHGYGVVSAIYDDNRTYPVQVTWDWSEYKKEGEIDSFTANGFTIIGLESDTGKLIVVESSPPNKDEKEWGTDKDIRDKRLDDNGINEGRRKIMDYQKIARGIVLNYVREHLDKTDNVHIALDDVYLVWFCKVLQNWKALVSTVLPDGMYYEVTYNGDKKEVYLDAYKKFDSREIDKS